MALIAQALDERRYGRMQDKPGGALSGTVVYTSLSNRTSTQVSDLASSRTPRSQMAASDGLAFL